jgi:2'-5' RNA ligase
VTYPSNRMHGATAARQLPAAMSLRGRISTARILSTEHESGRVPEKGRVAMPRLFTGIEVPAHVGLALSLKRGGLYGARWIDRENYHITLRFIGDVDYSIADEVTGALDHLVHSEAFSVRLNHLGSFGGDKPRALYAGVENNATLQRLQAAQERVLQRLGLQPDGRKFVPHVSLARLRGGSAEEVARFMAFSGRFEPLEFPVERFVLFSSRDSVGGGPYRIEESYPLAA